MTGAAAGFAEPGRDAQVVFRALMQAMSRPGTIGRITPALSPPAPLPPGCAALVLALVDGDTPVWLDAALAAVPDVAAFIRFHTGAPIVAEPGGAAFALAVDLVSLPPLDAFALGTLDDPDRSTTLILAVDDLRDGAGWQLTGPGIERAARLAIGGLPADFPASRAALAGLYPRGLDVVFVAGDAVAALPRTTRLET